MARHLTWWGELLKVWAQYLGVGGAFIPAGILFVCLASNGVNRTFSIALSLGFGTLLSFFAWRLVDTLLSPHATASMTHAKAGFSFHLRSINGQHEKSFTAADHMKQLSEILAALIMDCLFVALWTIVQYWMHKLFEQYDPSLDLIILHKVFEYSTLITVIALLVRDLARGFIRVFALSRRSGEDPETEVSFGDEQSSATDGRRT